LKGGTLNKNVNMLAPLKVPFIIERPKNAVKNKKKNKLKKTLRL